MAEKVKLLALFEDIDPAANGVDAIEELGVPHGDLDVITGAPINPGMLGRHHHKSRVPQFALGGALIGALLGTFLAFVTPRLYKVYVGGKPLSPGAPSIVVLFEMIMLLMLIATFLGVFLESVFPSYKEKEYVPEISDGSIGLIFDVEIDEQTKFEQALMEAGALSVKPAERQQP
jgi:hypothetical protein